LVLYGPSLSEIGEIGDRSVRDDLQKLNETESNPKVKTLPKDTVAKIAVHNRLSGTI